MKRHVLALLCAVNAVLALALAAMWFQPDGTLRNSHWAPPEPVSADFLSMVPVLPARKPVDANRLMAMLERPLFSATRRPAPVPVAEAAAPTDNLSTARLLGVFEGAQTNGAILQIAGKSRRVKLHESVDGWVLQSVQGRAATFVSAGQTRTLPLTRALVGGNSPGAVLEQPQPQPQPQPPLT